MKFPIQAPKSNDPHERYVFDAGVVANLETEVDTTAASSGTDGTISSRSAVALGECDGFVKLYIAGGTAIYLPYWESIAP